MTPLVRLILPKIWNTTYTRLKFYLNVNVHIHRGQLACLGDVWTPGIDNF